MSSNTKNVKNLNDILKSLTCNELKDIGYLLNINKLSNKRKYELIDIIYNALTNKDELFKVIKRLISNEFTLLKRIIDNNGTLQDNNSNINDYYFLYMIGIIFLFEMDNNFYMSISNEVYNIIKNINLNKFNKIIKDNTKSYKLLKSMLKEEKLISITYFANTYLKKYNINDYMDIPWEPFYYCKRLDNISIIKKDNEEYFIMNN